MAAARVQGCRKLWRPPRAARLAAGTVSAASTGIVEDAASRANPGPLLGMSQGELERLATSLGEQKFRGKQLYQALYKSRVATLGEATSLPKGFRGQLEAEALTSGRLERYGEQNSKDGTRKLLLKLKDGLLIETVGIPTDERLTVCVSSQVGCPMACTFCSTGKGGFARSLHTSEIVAQVIEVEQAFGRRASNCVFMGMGEPLLATRQVIPAVQSLNRDLGLGARSITISTVGVPNMIRRLANQAGIQLTLAVSLHAPTQELRETLIPSAKSYTLDALLEDCREFIKTTHRRITFEYTLIGNKNDSQEHAKQLAGLLISEIGKGAHVNLVPWNPFEDATFDQPREGAVRTFQRTLSNAGISATVRTTRGSDASAACGQLRNEFQRRPLPA